MIRSKWFRCGKGPRSSLCTQVPYLAVKKWNRSIITESNIFCKCIIPSKIEKVPRGIRGEKSSKDMASSRNLVSTIGALASPKIGDGTRCPEG